MYNVPGIYQIKNTVTGDSYIGSASNLRTRKNRHWSELEKQTHYNIHLQRAWHKYDGKYNFEFKILLICESNSLEYYEQKIIDLLHPQYNIRPDATSNLGVKRSDEYKKTIGDFFRGKKLSREHIRNRDLSMCMNNFNTNPTAGIRNHNNRFYPYFRNKYLGSFKTLEEAKEVYKKEMLNFFAGGY